MTAPVTESQTQPVAPDPLVQVRDLVMHFPVRRALPGRPATVLRAVDGVSFDIRAGETLGLVGETGCGKSTTGRSVLQLHRPTNGSVQFDGRELTTMTSRRVRSLRRDMQMVFQDPLASLNPRMTVGKTLAEAISTHDRSRSEDVTARTGELMDAVGLPSVFVHRFPHELSGGQRQRVGIARALAVRPRFIVADEPVAALDVSIQAQIINLLEDLQDQLGLTYLFIAHDLAVVRHVSDRVAVMYLGKIVELADSEELYANPLHPYTQALLSAIPVADPVVEAGRERIVLRGDVPSPVNPPSGCRFRTRCWRAQEVCAEIEPELRVDERGHGYACHFPGKEA